MPKYRVNEIYRSIQGEGINTGRPCTIVRFQGCNLRCSFCDTPYALDVNGGTEYDEAELISAVMSVASIHDIILYTGGEPTLQDIKRVIMLHTHLETNGTMPVPSGFEWVTVSPKPGSLVSYKAMQKADEVKWLISDKSDVSDLGTFLEEWEHDFRGVVSVQPVSQDAYATKVAYQACLDYGWRLSLQTHKFIEVK